MGVALGVGLLGTGVWVACGTLVRYAVGMLVRVGVGVGEEVVNGRLTGLEVRVAVLTGFVSVGAGEGALHPAAISPRETRKSNEAWKNRLYIILNRPG